MHMVQQYGVLIKCLPFSMSKARKLGWHGFVDTEECIYEALEDFVKLKMLPPVPSN